MKKTTKSDLDRFNSFKKKNGFSDADIKKIASEYAKSPEEYAKSYFAEQYGISEHILYRMLEYAIICHLVDDATRKKIRAKAVSNYKLHNEKERAKKVMDHYADLTRRREKFFDLIPKEDIIEICYMYVKGESLTTISNTFGYCVETIRKLLAKGIIMVIIPSSVVDLMRKRLQKEGGDLFSFERLEKKRNEVRSRALKPFEDEIKVLEFQIQHYDDYFEGDECAFEKAYLERRLEQVKNKFEKWLDF